MGDPRKQRRKYSTPSHPWQKERILEEKELMQSYGLKNKSEIWRAGSYLKNILTNTKNFVTLRNPQEKLEKAQLLKRLMSFGFVDGSDIGKALDLKINDILERRLQTIVHRKGLARSMKQSRQFITHRHIEIDGKKITMPSYKVTLEQEKKVALVGTSSLSNDDHPERKVLIRKEKKDKKPRSSARWNKGSPRGRPKFNKGMGRSPPRGRPPANTKRTVGKS